MSSIVRLYKAFDDAPPVRRADKTAAGSMPAAAFQYCEAMREASAYGWHVYPPKDISVLFDGEEIYHHDGAHWNPVKSQNFDGAFRDAWNDHAPEDLRGFDPPFLSEPFVAGVLQIWSGYFVSTAPGWSINIRPVVNSHNRSSLIPYEGIVETDTFQPMPLFVNVKLIKTDVEIFIFRDRPLFQMQPVMQSNYRITDDWLSETSIFDGDRCEFDWDGLRTTLRRTDARHNRNPGRYGANVRKLSRK